MNRLAFLILVLFVLGCDKEKVPLVPQAAEAKKKESYSTGFIDGDEARGAFADSLANLVLPKIRVIRSRLEGSALRA